MQSRKPYVITKQREKWTDQEHGRFLDALRMYGRAWRRIEEHIGTKTAVQIRSHAQKFFSKLEKQEASGAKAEGAALRAALSCHTMHAWAEALPGPRAQRAMTANSPLLGSGQCSKQQLLSPCRAAGQHQHPTAEPQAQAEPPLPAQAERQRAEQRRARRRRLAGVCP